MSVSYLLDCLSITHFFWKLASLVPDSVGAARAPGGSWAPAPALFPVQWWACEHPAQAPLYDLPWRAWNGQRGVPGFVWLLSWLGELTQELLFLAVWVAHLGKQRGPLRRQRAARSRNSEKERLRGQGWLLACSSECVVHWDAHSRGRGCPGSSSWSGVVHEVAGFTLGAGGIRRMTVLVLLALSYRGSLQAQIVSALVLAIT